MKERQAKAQPCFMPLTRKGSEVGKMTLVHLCKPRDPMVRAARAKMGGMLRTSVSVLRMTRQIGQPPVPPIALIDSRKVHRENNASAAGRTAPKAFGAEEQNHRTKERKHYGKMTSPFNHQTDELNPT